MEEEIEPVTAVRLLAEMQNLQGRHEALVTAFRALAELTPPAVAVHGHIQSRMAQWRQTIAAPEMQTPTPVLQGYDVEVRMLLASQGNSGPSSRH